MVKIRLRRMGAKKAPFYRVVVADEPATINIDMERANYWISNGAQPTDTVRGLLKRAEG